MVISPATPENPVPYWTQTDYIRAHYQSLRVAWAVPVVQAVTTGALMGLPFASAAWLINLEKPWLWGINAMLFTQAGVWLYSLRQWRIHVHNLETTLGIDINGDGRIGERERPEPVRVEILENGGRNKSYVELPPSREKLIALGDGIVNHKAEFTQSAWAGRGKIFSRSEWEALIQEMLRREMVRRANTASNSPYCLTHRGAEVMRHFASMAASPPPGELRPIKR